MYFAEFRTPETASTDLTLVLDVFNDGFTRNKHQSIPTHLDKGIGKDSFVLDSQDDCAKVQNIYNKNPTVVPSAPNSGGGSSGCWSFPQ